MEADFANPQHEWWPRSSDGRLVPLVLQTADEPHLLPETTRWTRIGKVTSRVSPIARLSYWIGSSLFVPGTCEYRLNTRSLAVAGLKLLVSWPLLFIFMFWTGYHALLVGSDVFEDQRRQSMGPLLKYEAVHDEHIDYVPTDSDADSVPPRSDDDSPPAPSETDGEIEPERQYQDNIRLTEASTSADAARATDDDIPTSVRPRYLCFAKDFEAGTYETVRVSDYIKQNGDDVDLEFVFVSYTRMQFRVATDDEISNATYPDEATREANRELARQDRELLVRWGMDAARKVGKRAFWLDFECVRDNESMAGSTSSSDDVYHICDIVRAAHSMIIAIGPPASDKVASIREGQEPPPYSREYVTPWLRQWGSRLWTLPELLLCPGEYRIRLYVAGDPSEPKAMAKRNFAERAWDDAGAVKELVNHFEGSAILTSQALIEAAFECFSRRQTEQLTQGDIAYAIMGLFPSRYRPRVDKSHSGFQAFARLALANDSGALLERLICLAPRPGAPWYQTEDCWGVQLSDMHSYIKVDKVLGSDTVLLNGVWAAAIQWDDMRPETAIDGESSKLIKIYLLSASAMSLVVPAMCGYLFPSIALIVDSSTPPDSLPVLVLSAFIGFLLSLMALMAVLAPVALNRSRAQSKQPIKARLIGIEGTVDAGTAEKLLWGHAHGNLVDTTPCSYSDADESSSREPPSPPEKEDFAFTLVDTYSMTVMHCRCSMPPTAMMIFGRESGMKRTILCSYDWRTQTYHRQAVLRLDRQGLDRMHKVDDVRFSLGPHPERQQLASCMLSPAAAQMPKLGWNSWKRELLFLAMCFFASYLGDPYLGYRRHPPSEPIFRGVSKMVSLLLGVGLLSRLPLSYTFPPVIVARLFLPILGSVVYMHVLLDCVLTELVNGLFTLNMVAYTLCWYPAEQVALRFLLWTVVAPKFLLMLAVLGLPRVRLIAYVFDMVLFYCVQISGRWGGAIGGPRDVSWLSAEQRTMYAKTTAAGTLAVKTGRAMWRRKRSSIKYAQPLVVLGASLLHTLSTGLDTMEFWWHVSPEAAVVLTMVVLVLAVMFVGRVSSRFPSALFLMMVLLATAASLLHLHAPLGDRVGILLRLFLRPSVFVMSLLWAVVVRQASTWLEAMGTIALAVAGRAVEYAVLFYTGQDEEESWGMGVYGPLFLGQMVLWGLLWVCIRFGRGRLPQDSTGAQA